MYETKKARLNAVLVGVVKDRRDLGAMLAQKWYRIPVKHAPRRKFKYIAFYQPAGFGRRGKRIRYYACVLDQQMARRRDLLPGEPKHPRADEYYFLFRLDKIKKLSRPIRNIMPRRISFGFTTLGRLWKAKNILELYDVASTEEILKKALLRAGLRVDAQQYVPSGRKRYYVDFAIFCKKGAIAIECDNKKAHSSRIQRRKDRMKNSALRHLGWKVIRLPEKAIVSCPEGCILKIRKAIHKLGGLD